MCCFELLSWWQLVTQCVSWLFITVIKKPEETNLRKDIFWLMVLEDSVHCFLALLL